jgi:hypothetical protein
MCINIIPTTPWSPWWNEEQQPLHRLQYVNQVDGLLKSEERTCLSRTIEDRGPPSRWPEDMLQRNFHCAIYNIKQNGTVWKRASFSDRPYWPCPDFFFSPPDPPRSKSTTHPKISPHQTSPSPVHWPRDRSHRQVPIRESSAWIKLD